MKIRNILIAAGLALVSSTAFAFQCPKDMKAIDAALTGAKLSDAQLTEVKNLRAEGEKLHKEGKHKDSVDALAKAKKMLGI